MRDKPMGVPQMTDPDREGPSQNGAGYVTGMLGAFIVLMFFGLTLLFGRNAWPVLGLGWLMSVIGALMAEGLYGLFLKAGIAESGWRGAVPAILAIIVGLAVPVVSIVILWSYY
jgi:hypothetical protein